MQTVEVYTYPIKLWPVLITDDAILSCKEYRIVYSRPITIFKGVQNKIKLWCLNTDQKPINISNVSLTCNLFTPGTQYEWVSKTVANIDNANGVAQVAFLDSDLAALNLGTYELGMTATDTNTGDITPVYLNDNYQGRLPFLLEMGPVSALTNPIPVVFTDTPSVGVVSNYIDMTNRPAGNNISTFTANLVVPYTGNILAQGAIVTNPVNIDFGNIIVENYSNVSGQVMFNVPGTITSLRFILDSIDPNGRYGNAIPSDYITSACIRY